MTKKKDKSIIKDTFDDSYGLEILVLEDEYVEGRTPVEKKVFQPFGLVHGGVLASMAEALASLGTWWKISEEQYAVGMSNQINFLRPISEGNIHAVARARHRGKTTWVWDVEFNNDQGKLCAVARMTIGVVHRNRVQPTKKN